MYSMLICKCRSQIRAVWKIVDFFAIISKQNMEREIQHKAAAYNP